MGIEPTCSAWKADILPLNYTRIAFQQMILYHIAMHKSIVKYKNSQNKQINSPAVLAKVQSDGEIRCI